MSIIEKEINRRESLIAENSDKIERIAALKAEAAQLQAEVADFNEEALREEIAELKCYLPAPEEPENADTDEVVTETAGYGTPFSY